jgi:hypothetical protein
MKFVRTSSDAVEPTGAVFLRHWDVQQLTESAFWRPKYVPTPATLLTVVCPYCLLDF